MKPATPSRFELTIGADDAEVRRASEWLETTAAEQGIPKDQVARLELSLNEALANVIRHGGPTALAKPVDLVLEIRCNHDGGNANITISDSGIAFDPLGVEKKALPRSLEEAAPNGMGLGMIRRCSDSLFYRHEGGRNHLTFGTTWHGSAAPGKS
jgi:anti-sigma regulatory factor (Ser/Thr protein kinase)